MTLSTSWRIAILRETLVELAGGHDLAHPTARRGALIALSETPTPPPRMKPTPWPGVFLRQIALAFAQELTPSVVCQSPLWSRKRPLLALDGTSE
jgi:hypothetical protein